MLFEQTSEVVDPSHRLSSLSEAPQLYFAYSLTPGEDLLR